MTNVLKWSGTLFTVLGALLTSLSVDPWNVYIFNVGSVFWLIASVKMRETSLVVVNVALLVVYAYGVVLRIVH